MSVCVPHLPRFHLPLLKRKKKLSCREAPKVKPEKSLHRFDMSPCYTPPSSSIYLSPAPKKQKQKKFSPFTICPSISFTLLLYTTQNWQSLFTIYKLHFWIWRPLAIHTHITDLFIELQRVPVSPGCFPLRSSQDSNQQSSKSPSPKTCRSSIGQQYSFNSTRRLGSSRH